MRSAWFRKKDWKQDLDDENMKRTIAAAQRSVGLIHTEGFFQGWQHDMFRAWDLHATLLPSSGWTYSTRRDFIIMETQANRKPDPGNMPVRAPEEYTCRPWKRQTKTWRNGLCCTTRPRGQDHGPHLTPQCWAAWSLSCGLQVLWSMITAICVGSVCHRTSQTHRVSSIRHFHKV
jgi:hypothetical protein